MVLSFHGGFRPKRVLLNPLERKKINPLAQIPEFARATAFAFNNEDASIFKLKSSDSFSIA